MTATPTARPAVRLQRTIPAPPERVYRAWLDPELMRRWLAPDALEVTRAEVDERVGGSYRVWQGNADGDSPSCTSGPRSPTPPCPASPTTSRRAGGWRSRSWAARSSRVARTVRRSG